MNALTGNREGAHLVAILSACEVDVSSKSNASLNEPIAAQLDSIASIKTSLNVVCTVLAVAATRALNDKPVRRGIEDHIHKVKVGTHEKLASPGELADIR